MSYKMSAKIDGLENMHNEQVVRVMNEISKLKDIEYDIGEALNENIDNGLTQKYLDNVRIEYANHLMMSDVVQEFFNFVSDNILTNVCDDIKSKLVVLDLGIQQSYNKYEPYISSPVRISYATTDKSHNFTLGIPVKDAFSLDVISNNNVAAGCYSICDDMFFCAAYDVEDLGEALTKYLETKYLEGNTYTSTLKPTKTPLCDYASSISKLTKNLDYILFIPTTKKI